MRIIEITAKCSDLCFSEYIVNGITVAERDGYPLDIKGLGNGDYIKLKLDLDSGKILNWSVPSHEQIIKAFEEDAEDYDEEDDDDEDGFIVEGDIVVEKKSDIVNFTKDSSFTDFPEGWVRTSKERWKK